MTSDPHSAAEQTGRQVAPAERGRTVIGDGVVDKIAGTAATQVAGVHAMGKGLARTVNAVRDWVPGTSADPTHGVNSESGEQQAAIDIALTVEYDVPIRRVAAEVRERVIADVERMTGLEVVEVNITVGDVHLPGDDDGDDDASSALK